MPKVTAPPRSFPATPTEPSSIQWPIDSSMPRSINSVEFELVLPTERKNLRDLAVYRRRFSAMRLRVFFGGEVVCFRNASVWLCLCY